MFLNAFKRMTMKGPDTPQMESPQKLVQNAIPHDYHNQWTDSKHEYTPLSCSSSQRTAYP